MTTLAEHIIVAGAENRPLMLEKSMYDSWASRIHLFIKGKKLGRIMLDLIDIGPLVYPTVDENGQTRPMKYFELTKAQQLQDDSKSSYTTNYDQLYAYLSQHERHANEVCITCERYPDPLALVANSPTLYNPSQSPQQSDYSLTVPMFQQGEDLIECINKAMVFLSAVASRFPPSNNQLRTSSNPKNQATIQDGRVIGNYAAGQPRVMKCYNCQGKGHMMRQYTQPKRPWNAAWFKEKLMLVEAQEASQILDEEQLAFLADPGIIEAPVAQQKIPQNLAFQTKDLDAYDSDCDDLSLANAVLMTNLSSCNPKVLSEVPYSDSYPNDMINQDVQEMQYS
ncbi:hypothetical protein Tco_1451783 [Tanacetum coccineum]